MITTIVRFRLAPGEDHAGALAEVRKTIPLYQAAGPALIRKAIHIDAEKGEGLSIYLWQDRASAERFFEMASANIMAKTGYAPQVEYLDCHVLVDNQTGDVCFT